MNVTITTTNISHSISLPLLQGTGLQSSNLRRSLSKATLNAAQTGYGNENTNTTALGIVWTPQGCVVCTHKHERRLRHELGISTQGHVSPELHQHCKL
jgi:hypothetical protein